MKLSGVSKGVNFFRRKKLVLESKSLWWTSHNPSVRLTSWNFTYNLLIEIEVITGKSQTKAIKVSVWDFPVMTEQTRLTFEKTLHLSELYTWARDTVRWHWSADILFGSCQLTITWLSTIKLITDCICLGQLASNSQSLQENSQSECAHYCSHIIFTVYFLVPVVTPDAVPGATGPSLLELDLFSMMVSDVTLKGFRFLCDAC